MQDDYGNFNDLFVRDSILSKGDAVIRGGSSPLTLERAGNSGVTALKLIDGLGAVSYVTRDDNDERVHIHNDPLGANTAEFYDSGRVVFPAGTVEVSNGTLEVLAGGSDGVGGLSFANTSLYETAAGNLSTGSSETDFYLGAPFGPRITSDGPDTKGAFYFGEQEAKIYVDMYGDIAVEDESGNKTVIS